jgi:hypothetical protein
MALKKSQKSLRAWTKQKWRTKSGKPSTQGSKATKWRTKSGKPSTQGSKATGERYLPEKAIKNLSAEEYAATSRAKKKGTKAGKQFVKQPKRVAKKTKKFRKVT